MTDSVPEPSLTGAAEHRPTEHRGEPPAGASTLNDDVAQEAATGSGSPDADQHVGSEAPASEGQLSG